MRVCYLGDANVQVRRVAEYFAGAGCEVHLLTARPRPLEGIAVHSFAGPLAKRRAAFVLGVPAARRLVARLKPDLMHAFYATSYGMVASLIPGPPVALSPMGTDVLLSTRASRLSAAMVRRAIRRAGVIFSVAPHMTRRLIELGAQASAIRTFPRGVDLRRFPMAPRRRDPERPVILSNRRLEPVYNIEQLVRAAPEVVRRHPGARFVIYGDGELRGHLESIAAAGHLGSSLRFAGAVDHDRVPQMLAEADIYVSCSRSDGASVSLLEAMACGLYPVVSDIEANRVWIDGANGALVPLDDSSALAETICAAIEHLREAERVAATNRRLIEARASWAANMPRMHAAYEDLVKGRRPEGGV